MAIKYALLVRKLADYVLQVVVRENSIFATPVEAGVTACVVKPGCMVSVVSLNNFQTLNLVENRKLIPYFFLLFPYSNYFSCSQTNIFLFGNKSRKSFFTTCASIEIADRCVLIEE